MIFFNNLNKYKKDIAHGIMEIADGSANPFSDKDAAKNVINAVKKIGLKRNVGDLVFSQQIHSANMCFCQNGGIIKLRTDAMVTNKKSLVLVVKTADCLPILFYDPANKIAGAIHAGRAGLEKEIIRKTIRRAGVDAENLIVGIGPHIRKCCYYLRGNVLEKYKKSNKFKKYLDERDGKVYLDLTAVAIDQLISSGVKMENIEDKNICTFCQGEGRFFSARRREKEAISKRQHKCFGSFISIL